MVESNLQGDLRELTKELSNLDREVREQLQRFEEFLSKLKPGVPLRHVIWSDHEHVRENTWIAWESGVCWDKHKGKWQLLQYDAPAEEGALDTPLLEWSREFSTAVLDRLDEVLKSFRDQLAKKRDQRRESINHAAQLLDELLSGDETDRRKS
jgi:hypothetical protein